MSLDIKKIIKEAKSSETLQIEDVKISDENWSEIAQLVHLKYLYFHRIKNSELPNKLSNLKQLDAFAVSGEKISKIPSFILKLPKLTSLNLNDTKITDFSFLKSIPNLAHLYLSDCNLDRIPDEIFYLENLETLRLGRNNIAQISNKIVQLKRTK